jgi:hypothetical protein
MNKLLVKGLKKLHESGGGPINLRELRLHRTVWDNFQKLRYWDLVEKSYDSKKQRIGGTWEITDKGIRFIEGKCRVSSTVWTFRGNRVRYSGSHVTFAQVNETAIFSKDDYREKAVPHKIGN